MGTSCGCVKDLSEYLIFISPPDGVDLFDEEGFLAIGFGAAGMMLLLPKISNSLVCIKWNRYRDAFCFFALLFPFRSLFHNPDSLFIAFPAKRLFNAKIDRIALLVHLKRNLYLSFHVLFSF